jgi:hypothetical protein
MTYATDLPDLQTCVTIFIILIFAYAAAWVASLIVGE